MNKEKYRTFEAGINDQGKRVDRIIRQFIPGHSLSGIYKAFRKGMIRVNGSKTSAERKIEAGDTIEIYKALLETLPKEEEKEKRDVKRDPEFTRQILFEDDDLLAINKKRGQLVHGGQDSLEEKVRNYLKDTLTRSLSFRPGPLHRLDRNTSGLIFFSRSIQGARNFSRELQEGHFTKYYLALVDGSFKKMEIWVDNLQRDDRKKTSSVENEGAEARTTVYPVRTGKDRSLVLAVIETGRTHQIRVQCAHHGYPLSGDRKYGGKALQGGYFLHSLFLITSEPDKMPSLNKIKADLKEKELNRLIRFFPGCTINELKSDLSKLAEVK